MKKQFSILILSAILCLSFCSKAIAQQSIYKKFEVGAGAGAAFYSGDVHQMPRLMNIRPGVEAFFRYNMTTYFAGRVYLQTGRFVGDYANSADESLQGIEYSFKSGYTGAGIVFEYNFFNFRGIRELHRMSPYVFAGFGIDNINVDRFVRNREATPQLLGFTPNIPFGVGVKYALNYRLNLAAELRTVKPFSDAIDGIDSDVSNNTVLEPKNDLYYFVGFSVAYRFITIRCPETSLDYF